MSRRDDPMTTKSKYMSYVLRHKPEAGGLTLDENGWADVDQLVRAVDQKHPPCSREIIEQIVAADSKQRYSFNEDGTKIRANQGHSIRVDLGLEPTTPPDVLYHGTATRFMRSIKKEGLRKMRRSHVHLSASIDTAVAVGKRHGVPIVLKIDALRMHTDGNQFFRSENGVWLTDHVDPQYFEAIEI